VLALIPGASRSASTILGGLIFGLSRRAATEFSFYLAIPTLAAASGYALLKELRHLTAADLPVFAVGFVVSFLAAAVVVRVFLAYVRTRTLVPFAWYRIAVGGLILALAATGRWVG
jgi:undecaprenyl-diphosphatase